MAWDQGTRRWHGKAEDLARLAGLQQFVAVHGGVIEVPTRG
jgi:hypothetical protein